MSGPEALYRVAMARPHDAHARRSGSAIVAILVLGMIVGAVVAVPMLLG